MNYIEIKTPVGPLKLIASERGLCAVLWEKEKLNRVALNSEEHIENPRNHFLKQAKRELEEYFAGKRCEFTVALDFIGTDFQKKVWKNLQKISYGQTASYKDLAIKIKKPTAARAVGMANGKNPLSIIIPCHRVIGANGALTGYAGGLENKKILLELESKS